MTDTFEYKTRPGNLTLTFVAFGGLTLLAAQLWHILPGVVILLLVPALLTCLWQIIVTPVYGLSLSRHGWQVINGRQDLSIPACDIAYLRLTAFAPDANATLVLTDGSEVALPTHVLPNPLDLIREATNRGIPVREG